MPTSATCQRARAHRTNDSSSRGARHFGVHRRPDGKPTEAASGTAPDAPFEALRLASEDARRIGRHAASQHTRSGAEADSKPDVHLLSPTRAAARPGLRLAASSSAKARFRLAARTVESSAKPRCLPPPGTTAGALPPAGPSRVPPPRERDDCAALLREKKIGVAGAPRKETDLTRARLFAPPASGSPRRATR